MKKIIAMLMTALMIVSAMCIPAFAETEEIGEQEEQLIEETEDQEQTEEVSVSHAITVADEMMEKGFVIPSRRNAKEGDAVVLTAYEKEYTEDGKEMKYEFVSFECENATIIPVNHTTAFFFMPDEDVEIVANYRTVDLTEYYDWNAVIEKIGKMKTGSSLVVDMKNETVVPKEVLDAFDGEDKTVSFMTDNCFYSVNGKNIVLEVADENGYSLSYEDYSLTRYYKLKLGNSAVMAVEVKKDSNHSVTAELHCFCDKNAENAYLYRLYGQKAEFVGVVSVKNGEVSLPVSESGIYAVTTKVLVGTKITMKAEQDKRVLLNGKLLPLTAYEDGELTFTVPTSGTLEFVDYTNPYKDTEKHEFEEAVCFVSVRNLMEGADDSRFYPDAGASVEDFSCAVARLRQISDKSAMEYTRQAGIINETYEVGSRLTRNDVSYLMTRFVKYIMSHPEQFGEVNRDAFGGNAGAWMSARFVEMSGSSESFNWSGVCTRGELAYLLMSVVNAMTADAQ